MSSCATTRLALGAYVLGGLDAAERAEVDAHLATCAACRDQLVAFAPLPGLLSRLTADEVLEVPQAPPAALLDRTLARLRQERRRTRLRQRWGVAAAAAAVAVGVLLTATTPWRTAPPAATPTTSPTVTSTPSTSTTPAFATVSATDPVTQVTATAQLHARGWGTEIGLQLAGVRAQERCRLVAVGPDGVREIAGSWAATYTGSLTVTNATSLQASQLRELRVVSADGRTLVAIPVRR